MRASRAQGDQSHQGGGLRGEWGKGYGARKNKDKRVGNAEAELDGLNS